ncbi:hypothetical protein FQA39_LY01723 [Lamprigera yunnana]|nr:hypothetical protein FQA39_LY01723 [Lamprigera yunnana]
MSPNTLSEKDGIITRTGLCKEKKRKKYVYMVVSKLRIILSKLVPRQLLNLLIVTLKKKTVCLANARHVEIKESMKSLLVVLIPDKYIKWYPRNKDEFSRAVKVLQEGSVDALYERENNKKIIADLRSQFNNLKQIRIFSDGASKHDVWISTSHGKGSADGVTRNVKILRVAESKT